MSQEIYTQSNVPLFEAMYGPGLISLGGYEAIDHMFKGISLSGKRLLDVGSGIGGMAYYLAKKYNALVTGLEIYPWMAEYARMHTPVTLQDRVHFITYAPGGLIPVPSQTFDIICSKGVLTNVPDKHTLFLELHRVLTPSGHLCLMDWIVPEKTGPQNITYSSGEVSCKETQSSYEEILSTCGFGDVTFEDESETYLKYAKKLGLILLSDAFKESIPEDLHQLLVSSNIKLIKDIEHGDQISVRIRGKDLSTALSI